MKDDPDAAPVGNQPTSSRRKRVLSDDEITCSGRKKRTSEEDELPLDLPLELKFSILQNEVVDLRRENIERISGQVNFLLSFLGIQKGQTVRVDREPAVECRVASSFRWMIRIYP